MLAYHDQGQGNPPADAPQEPQYTTYFDASRAWSHLHKQVSLGFRVPGTPGHTACRRYIVQELQEVCRPFPLPLHLEHIPVAANMVEVSLNLPLPRHQGHICTVDVDFTPLPWHCGQVSIVLIWMVFLTPVAASSGESSNS